MLKDITYLFPVTTRTQTPSAPVFDPTKNEKTWTDPNPIVGTDGLVTYTVLNSAGSDFTSLKLSKADAMALNLPGHPDYPAYSPAPSKATFDSNIFDVSSKDDAIELAKEFGVDPSLIVDGMANLAGTFPLVYPADDPRRAWILPVGGQLIRVSYLLQLKNANGVGAPGHWNGIVWISDLPSPTASSPLTPLPIDMSKVPANATVQPASITTGLPMLFIPDPPVASVPASGMFDPASDPTIQEILAGIRALRALLHV